MTAKQNSSTVPEADSEFHAVEWVRGVRDQMYAATSGLSADELIQFVRNAAAANNPGCGDGESRSDAPTA